MHKRFMKQLENEELESGQSKNDLTIKPVDMPFSLLKELGAKWLLETFEYVCNNTQVVVNGFVRSGITGAFDAFISQTPLSDDKHELSSDNEEDELAW